MASRTGAAPVGNTVRAADGDAKHVVRNRTWGQQAGLRRQTERNSRVCTPSTVLSVHLQQCCLYTFNKPTMLAVYLQQANGAVSTPSTSQQCCPYTFNSAVCTPSTSQRCCLYTFNKPTVLSVHLQQGRRCWPRLGGIRGVGHAHITTFDHDVNPQRERGRRFIQFRLKPEAF